MTPRRLRLFVPVLLLLPLLGVSAGADTLGAADTYAVIGGVSQNPGITNAPLSATNITGNMTFGSASSCTGFVPVQCTFGAGIVNGTVISNDAAAIAAFGTAQTALANTGGVGDSGVTDWTATPTLGSLGLHNNIAPGIYEFDSSVTVLGTLTLQGGGDPNALWIFQIGTTLTTGSNASVVVTGTGTGAGLYWQVGSSAAIFDNSVFQGNILAATTIDFKPGAQDICGRAFSDTLVSFDGVSSVPQENVISDTCTQSASGFNGGVISRGEVVPGTGGTTVPEPGTLALLSSGLLGMVFLTFRKSRVSSL
jgi:hypothetical protein